MRKIGKILLSLMMFCSLIMTSYEVKAQETKEVNPIFHKKAKVSITNGVGFVDVSKVANACKDKQDVTVNTTFTCTGSSVNSIFFIGDSTKANNYLTVYKNGNTIGVESRNESGAQQIDGGTVDVSKYDFTKEHKFTFVLNGGKKYAMYLDGKKIKESNTSVNFTKGVITAPNYIGFGKGNRASGQNNYPFTGTQSCMELYNVALSEDAILSYHTDKEREDLVYVSRNVMKKQDSSYTSDTNAEHVAKLKSLNKGSMNVWYRAASENDGLMSLLSLSDSTNNGKYLMLYVNPKDNTLGVETMGGTGTNKNFEINASNTPVLNNDSIHNTKWHMLTVTSSGSNYYFYLDGKYLNKYSTNVSKFMDGVDSANSIGVGYTDRASGNEYNFKGGIESAKVYANPLTEEEISSMHSQFKFQSEMVDDLSNAYKTKSEALFYSGYDNSVAYRIPSLLRTKAGTLLAAIDRRNSGYHDAGNIDTIIRRRESNQKEFDNPIEVIDLVDKNRQTPCAFVIDPSLTSYKYMENGVEKERIILMVDMFPNSSGLMNKEILSAGTGYKDINGKKYQVLKEKDNPSKEYTIRENGVVYDEIGNKTDYRVITKCKAPYKELGNLYYKGESKGNIYLYDNTPLQAVRTQYLWMTYSDDDGKTWENPIDITSQVKEDWMLFCGTGPGVGIQLKDGSLAVPVYTAGKENLGGSQASALIVSKDGGKTWTLGDSPVKCENHDRETMNNSGAMLTESQVIQLNNGDVKLFMRNTSGKTKMATSKDGGKTWQKMETLDAVNNAYCQLSVTKYDKNGKEYIVLVTPSKGGRMDGTIYYGEVQENGGITWTSKILHKGHFQYSSIVTLGTDDKERQRFGVMYEFDRDDGKMAIMYTEFDENFIHTEQVATTQQNPEVVGKKVVKNNDNIIVELTFDQVMMVAGTPKLNLALGGQEYKANYVSGSGTKVITFQLHQKNDLNGVLKANGFDTTSAYFENTINGSPIYKENLVDLTKIDRGVSVVSVTSNQSNDGGGKDAIVDGNYNTYWHSQYSPETNLPQEVVVKLPANKRIYKMAYIARHNNLNGCAKDYEIQVSKDNHEYKVVKSGQLKNINGAQIINFAPTEEISYVKFITKTTHSNGNFTSIGELEFYEYTNGVEFDKVNVIKLNELIKKLDVIDLTNYSQKSKEFFIEKLNAAKEIIKLANKDNQLYQSDIDEGYVKLYESYRGLVDIQAAIAMNNELNVLKEEEFTPSSWQLFTQKKSEIVENSIQEATKNKDVTDYIMKAQEAMNQLVKRADFNELNKAIEEIESENLQKEDYELVSWKAFEESLEKAKVVKNNKNATQEEVNRAKNELLLSRIALKVDKEALTVLYESHKDIDQTKYTGESYKVFKNAMTNAKVVIDDQQATTKQVQDAVKQLQKAIKALEEVKVVDKTALKEAIGLANTYEADKYTESSWNILLEKINVGTKIMNDATVENQSVVDQAKVEILKAISELELKEVTNKEKLQETIAKQPAKDKETYTNASWKAYEEAFAQANKVLANKDVTQKEIDAATKALQDAYNALKENSIEVPSNSVKPQEKPNSDKNTNKVDSKDIPNTAVSTNMMLLWTVLLASGACMVKLIHKKENM